MAEMTDAEKLEFILKQEESRRKTLTTEEQIDIALGRSGAAAAKLKQELFEQEKILEETVKKYNSILDAQNRLPEIQQQILDNEAKVQEYLNGKLQLSDEELDKLNKEYEQLIKLRDIAKEDATAVKKDIETQEKKNKELQKQNDKMNEQKSVANSLVNSAKDLYNQYFSLSGVMSIMSNTIKEIIDANQQFARSTGQIADNFVQFSDLSGLGQYGVTAGDLIKTNGELINSFSSFTKLNSSTQAQLASTAAKMDVLGISASETGQIYNTLTKSLGLAGEQAGKSMERIASTAMGMGVAPAKMAKDFSSAMSSLAANGKRAEDVFFALAKQSKSLGVEMNSLLSLAEGFDTFEGAAEKAGKLNSILGGNYLNSMEMVMASEEERINLIKQGFDLSGKQFNDLDRATQKSIAMSLGFKSAAEAAAVLGSSTSEMTADMQKAEASQKQMDEAMQSAASIGKQLQAMFNTLAPILNKIAIFIKDVVDVFSKFNSALGGAPALIILLVSVGTGLIGMLVLVAGAFMSAITSITTFGAAAPAAGTSIAATITALGTAITTTLTAMGNALANPKVMLGLAVLSLVAFSVAAVIASIGIAAAGIGYGIKLAAEGLATMVQSFKGLGDAAIPAAFAIGVFVIAFAAMMIALIGLAANPLSYAAVALMVAVGLAAIGIGTGIYIASKGLSGFIESIKGLIEKKSDVKEVMSTIGGSAVDIVKAFNEIKDAKVVSNLRDIQESFSHMQSEIALSQANLVSFVSTATTAATPISALNDVLTTMDTVMSKLSTTMWNLMWNLNKLGTEIREFPVMEAFVVTAMVKYLTDSLQLPEESKNVVPTMESISKTITTISTIKEEQLKPSMQFVESIKKIKTTKENDLDKVGELLKELINLTKPSEQKEKTNVYVQVLLDGQEISSKMQWGDELVSSLVGGGPTLNVTPAAKGTTK